MPARARPPSFQFYARDFLASQKVALMTPEEVGGYILLLCHAWLSDPPGTLPSDESQLAILSRLGDRWPACRDAIAACFKVRSEDGRWVQSRLVATRSEQRLRYARSRAGADATNARLDATQRTANARLAAQTRWRRKDIARIDECARMPGPASASASASAEESEARHGVFPSSCSIPSSSPSRATRDPPASNGHPHETDLEPPPDAGLDPLDFVPFDPEPEEIPDA